MIMKKLKLLLIMLIVSLNLLSILAAKSILFSTKLNCSCNTVAIIQQKEVVSQTRELLLFITLRNYLSITSYTLIISLFCTIVTNHFRFTINADLLTIFHFVTISTLCHFHSSTSRQAKYHN